MIAALFQRIPRCLFEPFAVLALIGFILFLTQHWRKDRMETLLLGGTLLFMIAWRVIMPIGADRYALILIPPALFFAVFAVEQIVAAFRHFTRLPGLQPLFLSILLICGVVKSFHFNAEDRQMFRMIDLMKKETGKFGKPVQIVANMDISYFLDDRSEVNVVYISGPFRLSELPPANCYLLKLSRKKMPLDPENPEFVQIFESHNSNSSKYIFCLWKRKNRK